MNKLSEKCLENYELEEGEVFDDEDEETITLFFKDVPLKNFCSTYGTTKSKTSDKKYKKEVSSPHSYYNKPLRGEFKEDGFQHSSPYKKSGNHLSYSKKSSKRHKHLKRSRSNSSSSSSCSSYSSCPSVEEIIPPSHFKDGHQVSKCTNETSQDRAEAKLRRTSSKVFKSSSVRSSRTSSRKNEEDTWSKKIGTHYEPSKAKLSTVSSTKRSRKHQSSSSSRSAATSHKSLYDHRRKYSPHNSSNSYSRVDDEPFSNNAHSNEDEALNDVDKDFLYTESRKIVPGSIGEMLFRNLGVKHKKSKDTEKLLSSKPDSESSEVLEDAVKTCRKNESALEIKKEANAIPLNNDDDDDEEDELTLRYKALQSATLKGSSLNTDEKEKSKIDPNKIAKRENEVKELVKEFLNKMNEESVAKEKTVPLVDAVDMEISEDNEDFNDCKENSFSKELDEKTLNAPIPIEWAYMMPPPPHPDQPDNSLNSVRSWCFNQNLYVQSMEDTLNNENVNGTWNLTNEPQKPGDSLYSGCYNQTFDYTPIGASDQLYDNLLNKSTTSYQQSLNYSSPEGLRDAHAEHYNSFMSTMMQSNYSSSDKSGKYRDLVTINLEPSLSKKNQGNQRRRTRRRKRSQRRSLNSEQDSFKNSKTDSNSEGKLISGSSIVDDEDEDMLRARLLNEMSQKSNKNIQATKDSKSDKKNSIKGCRLNDTEEIKKGNKTVAKINSSYKSKVSSNIIKSVSTSSASKSKINVSEITLLRETPEWQNCKSNYHTSTSVPAKTDIISREISESTLPFKFPPVKPVIIPLTSDSDSEDEKNIAVSKEKEQEDKVLLGIEDLIKSCRNKQSQHNQGKTSKAFVLKTPKGVSHLSKQQQEEYRQLKALMVAKGKALQQRKKKIARAITTTGPFHENSKSSSSKKASVDKIPVSKYENATKDCNTESLKESIAYGGCINASCNEDLHPRNVLHENIMSEAPTNQALGIHEFLEKYYCERNIPKTGMEKEDSGTVRGISKYLKKPSAGSTLVNIDNIFFSCNDEPLSNEPSNLNYSKCNENWFKTQSKVSRLSHTAIDPATGSDDKDISVHHVSQSDSLSLKDKMENIVQRKDVLRFDKENYFHSTKEVIQESTAGICMTHESVKFSVCSQKENFSSMEVVGKTKEKLTECDYHEPFKNVVNVVDRNLPLDNLSSETDVFQLEDQSVDSTRSNTQDNVSSSNDNTDNINFSQDISTVVNEKIISNKDCLVEDKIEDQDSSQRLSISNEMSLISQCLVENNDISNASQENNSMAEQGIDSSNACLTEIKDDASIVNCAQDTDSVIIDEIALNKSPALPSPTPPPLNSSTSTVIFKGENDLTENNSVEDSRTVKMENTENLGSLSQQSFDESEGSSDDSSSSSESTSSSSSSEDSDVEDEAEIKLRNKLLERRNKLLLQKKVDNYSFISSLRAIRGDSCNAQMLQSNASDESRKENASSKSSESGNVDYQRPKIEGLILSADSDKETGFGPGVEYSNRLKLKDKEVDYNCNEKESITKENPSESEQGTLKKETEHENVEKGKGHSLEAVQNKAALSVPKLSKSAEHPLPKKEVSEAASPLAPKQTSSPKAHREGMTDPLKKCIQEEFKKKYMAMRINMNCLSRTADAATREEEECQRICSQIGKLFADLQTLRNERMKKTNSLKAKVDDMGKFLRALKDDLMSVSRWEAMVQKINSWENSTLRNIETVRKSEESQIQSFEVMSRELSQRLKVHSAQDSVLWKAFANSVSKAGPRKFAGKKNPAPQKKNFKIDNRLRRKSNLSRTWKRTSVAANRSQDVVREIRAPVPSTMIVEKRQVELDNDKSGDLGILCPHDLLGRCNDHHCPYHHTSTSAGQVRADLKVSALESSCTVVGKLGTSSSDGIHQRSSETNEERRDTSFKMVNKASLPHKPSRDVGSTESSPVDKTAKYEESAKEEDKVSETCEQSCRLESELYDISSASKDFEHLIVPCIVSVEKLPLAKLRENYRINDVSELRGIHSSRIDGNCFLNDSLDEEQRANENSCEGKTSGKSTRSSSKVTTSDGSESNSESIVGKAPNSAKSDSSSSVLVPKKSCKRGGGTKNNADSKRLKQVHQSNPCKTKKIFSGKRRPASEARSSNAACPNVGPKDSAEPPPPPPTSPSSAAVRTRLRARVKSSMK